MYDGPNPLAYSLAHALEAKAMACHALTKRYYGPDRYSVEVGEQLAIVLMGATEEQLRMLRDYSDEVLRDHIERAYFTNGYWPTRDSIPVLPVQPKKYSMEEVLRHAMELPRDERRELLARLTKELETQGSHEDMHRRTTL